jgi:tetratricopeptide (TPR) repeat protein
VITHRQNKILFNIKRVGVLALTLLFAFACSPSKKVSGEPNASHEEQPDHLTEAQRLQADFYFFNALKERAIGNTDDAKEYLEKTIAIDPKHATAFFERARIADSRNEHFLALNLIEKAYQLEPDNYWITLFYADALAKVNQNGKAIKVYEELYEIEKDRLEFLFDWAALLAQEKKYKDAIKILDKLENRYGISEPIATLKQKVYYAKGKPEQGIAEIIKLSEAFPDEVQYLGIIAEMYSELGKPEKSKFYYDKILQIDPDNGMVHLAYAEEARKAGNPDAFFSALEKAFASGALDIDTKIQILINLYSITEVSQKDAQRVYPLLNSLDSLYPKSPKTHSVYGDYLLRDRKLPEARDRFRTALKYDRSREAIWGELLFINYQLGDSESLVNDGKQATTLFPTYPQFYFFYALGLFEQKNYEEAAKKLEDGLDLILSNKELEAEFYSLLGSTYNKLERFQDSDKAYENALKIRPDDALVLNNYAYYLSVRKQNLKRAEEMSAKALKLKPNEPSYLDTYGWIMFQMGKYNDAKHFILRAIEVDPSPSGEVYEHLGDALFKLDDIEGALKYWQKAKSMGDTSPLIDKKINDQSYYE